MSWGHTSRKCVFCGKVGPRTQGRWGYRIGFAHKRCIPKEKKPVARPTPPIKGNGK